MLKSTNIEYYDGETLLEGYYVYNDSHAGRRPAILVAHDWSGKNEFACTKANELAELGYAAFALDMFGKGKFGKTKEEKSALIQPLMQNRAALQKRILAAFKTVTELEQSDFQKIGAIGFCFGGLCALDLARAGADVKAVVSFHGLLQASEKKLPPHPIIAQVLALHGYDDPMVTPETVMTFAREMTSAGVDWEINMYGNTLHAFTNPEANDPGFGTVYNKKSATRAWSAMKSFLNEILS